MNIHLGYEVGTGKAVEIPLRHLAVTGQTQESGKTTTLEALIYRSKLRAVAFLTKRGEASFHRARRILPYFRERCDWQFVRSILEATMRQGMKFQTSWIVKLCEARTSGKEKWPAPKCLADVRRNVSLALETARGLNESVYTELGAYLDIVLPQIDALPRAGKVELEPGINVMDLTSYSMEMQGLVIRSVLEWVHEREAGVITIIPEAWEFIPQDRGSPVLLAAQLLTRQGAGLKNFVWIDSQDIAGVHKTMLRSVGVWIFGVQREIREVKRTLEHIPVGSPMPKARDIMTLHKGEFFVCYEERMVKAYVMPYWLPEVEARAIALGESSVEKVAQFKPTGRAWESAVGSREPASGRVRPADGSAGGRRQSEDQALNRIADARRNEPCYPIERLLEANPEVEEDAVWKEKYEQECQRVQFLQDQVKDLTAAIEGLKKAAKAKPVASVDSRVRGNDKPSVMPAQAGIHPTPDCQLPTADLNGFYSAFKARLLADPQVLDVLAERPEIEVRVIRPTVQVDGASLKGRIAGLISEGWFGQPRSTKDVFQEGRRRFNWANPSAPRVGEAVSDLHTMGFLVRDDNGGYQAVKEMKVRIIE